MYLSREMKKKERIRSSKRRTMVKLVISLVY